MIKPVNQYQKTTMLATTTEKFELWKNLTFDSLLGYLLKRILTKMLHPN